MLLISFLVPALITVPSVLFAAILFTAVYFISKPALRRSKVEIKITTAQPAQPEEELSQTERIFKDIERLVEKDKIYTKKGLTINDIADLVHTNRTYASNAVNQCTGLTFTAWLNAFRIRHAQELLLEGDDILTISAIGSQSGFTSDATFIRNFKLQTGCTPSEWRQLAEKRMLPRAQSANAQVTANANVATDIRTVGA